jgi:uncharacterized GH25 family protein
MYLVRIGCFGTTLVAALLLTWGRPATAHDTWVQVSSNLVRPDDVVHVDLFLGNHGNDHRDFKIAGKLSSLEGATLAVVGPQGQRTDLAPDLVDLGYAPKEGFWSGRYIAAAEGLHCVAHTREGIRHESRGLKSGKAYFLVTDSLDRLPATVDGFATPLGHPLELVLETNPVLGCGAGKKIAVRLLLRGRPLADQRVSFIPRGVELKPDFDPDHERRTDAEGRCDYTPRDGNLLLIVAHHTVAEEKGEGYDKTAYSATLVLNVPQRCACCE